MEPGYRVVPRMTGWTITDPGQLRRGLRIAWEWGEGPAGQRMVAAGVPPRGRLVTVADIPGIDDADIRIAVDGYPGILLDPRLALTRGRDMTVIEDAPVPRVLNQRRDGRPAGAVHVGRPGPWGNPFVVGRHGDRDTVIARYIAWLAERPDLVARARRELAGKDLVCWCAPAACHGHVLRDLALGRPLPRMEQDQATAAPGP